MEAALEQEEAPERGHLAGLRNWTALCTEWPTATSPVLSIPYSKLWSTNGTWLVGNSDADQQFVVTRATDEVERLRQTIAKRNGDLAELKDVLSTEVPEKKLSRIGNGIQEITVK